MDVEEFAAVLKTFVPDASDVFADVGVGDVVGVHDVDEIVGVEGATDLSIEGKPKNGEDQIGPIVQTAVWAIADSAFAASTVVALVPPPNVATTTVPGQPLADAFVVQPTEADTVWIPAADTVKVVDNENSAARDVLVRATAQTAATHSVVPDSQLKSGVSRINGDLQTPFRRIPARAWSASVGPAVKPDPIVLTPQTESVTIGNTRPVNSPSDLLTAATTVNDVLQVDSSNRPPAPSIEGEGSMPVALSSSVDNAASAPLVSVARPMTSQVLVAMVQNLSVIKEQTSGSLTLRLDPPELGEIEMRFRQSEQGVELRLTARAPVTLQMLLSRGDEISRVLSGLDIDFSRVEISGDDSFRGGDEPSAFDDHSESEQQGQGTSAEQKSEDHDRRQRRGRIHPRRQVRTRLGIRA